MATLEELRAAIDHISACTGDKDAWRRDLSTVDLEVLSATAVDPSAATGLLAKVKANHPALFDPRTGAPITPASAGPPGQIGVAADAMKAAEDALIRQNSRTAEVDLQVITAIANAHSETEQGTARLRQLQKEIENAVHTRVDLDTPAGARDFQRYLIGKIREIAAVVESASLDSTSKAALAGALTVLYRSADRPESAPATASAAPSPSPSPAPVPQPPDPLPELPPYGADPLAGLWADSGGLAPETMPMAGQSAPMVPAAGGPPMTPLPSGAGGLPPFPMPSLASPLSGLTGGLSRTQADPLFDNGFAESLAGDGAASPQDRMLAELVAGLDEPSDVPDADEQTAVPDGPTGETGVAPADPGAATRVPLPDGSTVNAPSVALAEVMRATLAGTPIPEAFRAHGITVPPPGSSVGIPVEPSRVVAGDVGMFMEHQALALDSQRAWLGGQIQPVGAVTGPSFLGWLHPPAQAPIDTASPTTAPATAPGTAR